MRRTKKFQVLALALLGILVILFQNFDSSTKGTKHLVKIDQKKREKHAKELLGKNYRGSSAQRASSVEDLNVAIYQELHTYLPKKYRAKALPLAKAIIKEAQAQNMDPVFIMAVIKTESSFDPRMHGSAGEIGLMQIKPDTAEWVAKKQNLKWKGESSLENPVENVRLGIAYFAMLRDKFPGFANKYLSAYNMGQTKVRQMYAADIKPHEYSLRVMKNYQTLYKEIVDQRMTVVADN